MLHSRLAALAIGVGVAACAILAVVFALPAQSQLEADRDYGYVYSGAKSSSVEFVEANMDEASLLVFGSSEFSTPSRLVPQVPAQVFGTANYGLRPMLIGEAFDQSLWHAIALGAYAEAGIPRQKVALIVAPGWFVDGGQDPETFQTRFSYALYQRFCSNPTIPSELRAYVAQRLEQLGIDETQLRAASPELPQDYLNGAVFSALADLQLRQSLREVRAQGLPSASQDALATPDFAALRAEALADAQEKAATNDWGLEDGFYAQQLEPVLDEAAGSRSDERYEQTAEYDDLACFLSVADACGIEVLVVVSPVLGPYYDHIGIDRQVREGCYERIRAVVAEHPRARLADFSDREYERYFLYDIVHFGWTGWVDVEEALYGFALGGA